MIAGMMMSSVHQYDPVKCEIEMSSSVFQGSALPESAKMVVTLGTTETIRMPMMTAPMMVMTTG